MASTASNRPPPTDPMRRPTRAALAVAPLLLLVSACRVDTTVDLTVQPNGSGRITLTARADREVVQKAPGLAADLRFDDAEKAGWVNDRVGNGTDGSLEVVLHHDFTDIATANAILRTINGTNGPLHDVAVQRTANADEVNTSVGGVLRVDGGLDAFADPKALTAIGGTPYAADIAAANMKPADAVGITVVVHLPGAKTATYTVPIDGTAVTISSSSHLTAGASSNWGVLATVLLVALVAWCIGAALFVMWVVRERRRRALRRTAVDSRP